MDGVFGELCAETAAPVELVTVERWVGSVNQYAETMDDCADDDG